MAQRYATTADKIIVDRRKAPRNSDVARAVRRTRDRLSQRNGSADFENELLLMHAHAMLASATSIPLLALVVSVIGFLAGLGPQMVVWALITVSAYAVLGLIARAYDRTDRSKADIRRWRQYFMGGHALTSVAWAYLASMSCDTCGIDPFAIIQAMMLLIAMAATAIVSSALRGATIVGFALPVAVFTVFAVDIRGPVQASLVVMLIAALVFFSFISAHFRRSAVRTLEFQSEKDALIAELETAKSMSDEARRRAEEANLAKSRFLASMSHELRTPLNAILGFSEVMADEVLGPIENESYRDYAKDIHASGKHLLNLINEILDLSRIEAGRYALNEEAVKLGDIADECIHMMQMKARKKEIRLVPQFEESLPRLWADERSVRQIILNLLTNAVKFTPPGGEVQVKVGWTAGGGQYIAVKDNGPGIPPEEIPIVLSAFGQGSIAIKTAEEGTGLGLPIVQALTDMHGGEFHLNSKLREGTEALVIFPHSRVMEEMPAIPTSSGRRRRRVS